MNVFVNGFLAAKTGRSLLLGVDSMQEAAWFEEAYRDIFPNAEIHSEAEWAPWLADKEETMAKKAGSKAYDKLAGRPKSGYGTGLQK